MGLGRQRLGESSSPLATVDMACGPRTRRIVKSSVTSCTWTFVAKIRIEKKSNSAWRSPPSASARAPCALARTLNTEVMRPFGGEQERLGALARFELLHLVAEQLVQEPKRLGAGEAELGTALQLVTQLPDARSLQSP